MRILFLSFDLKERKKLIPEVYVVMYPFHLYHFSLVTSVGNIKSTVFPFICNICRTLLCLNKEKIEKHSDLGKLLLFSYVFK